MGATEDEKRQFAINVVLLVGIMIGTLFGICIGLVIAGV